MEIQGFLNISEIIFCVINWLSIENKMTNVLVAPSEQEIWERRNRGCCFGKGQWEKVVAVEKEI